MASTRKMLLMILSVPLGAINGALAGAVFGFILAFLYGWNPYFASMKGAMACSLVGAPTGLIGSAGLLSTRTPRARFTIFIVCGAVVASLLFLTFAENAAEAKSGLLDGIAMGTTIGAMIGGCMLVVSSALLETSGQ